jgi:dolichol-phosphate mannosyltransferase
MPESNSPISSEKLDITVVIPVFNEEENLAPLWDELVLHLDKTGKKWEVLFIDDASTDSSPRLLDQMAAEDSRVRVIHHKINSGESAGQATGFRFAKGDLVITMDADQQNDPADIPAMLEALTPQIDCVCGVRRIRQDDWVRRFSSRTANRFRNTITGDRISDAGCTYRVIRRSAVQEVPVFNGMHRFLPTLLRAQGYQVVELLVNHRPRVKGVSKYGVGNRLWRGIRDCFAMRWYQRRVISGKRL